MAKKKKDDVKIIDAEIIGEDKEEAVVPKGVQKSEDKTLFWFFVVVGLVFACVLVPYFWVESNKSFELGGIDWVIEDYEHLKIFHGRFVSLTNSNLNYNVFFRTDPRTNDAAVKGEIKDFKYGGIISLSPEVDACRGDLSRVMLDLGAFLKQGVGVGPIESGTNSKDVANETSRRFVDCENVMDRTVIIIDVDGERGTVKSDLNPNCYIITAEDCEDSGVVEKFMLQSVIDFRIANPDEDKE